jgi:signal transduction histidine kinase
VVDNLVHNAARHAPSGTPVRLSARVAATGATLTVTDEGVGIPVEERAQVFERFYRADAGRSSDLGGTGLGLAIARWIVDLHGGEVRIEDNVPSGCQMVVELPSGRAVA